MSIFSYKLHDMARGKIVINNETFRYRTGFSDSAFGGDHWTKFYRPEDINLFGMRFSKSAFAVSLDIDNIYHKKSTVDQEIANEYNRWKNSLLRVEELKEIQAITVKFVQD